MPDWTSQRISIKHIPESHIIMCRCSGRTNDVHFKTLGEKTVSVLKIVRKRKSEERLPAVKQRSRASAKPESTECEYISVLHRASVRLAAGHRPIVQHALVLKYHLQ